MENRKNFIMISPHFPDNFATFALRLKEAGINTLGIADAPYEQLSDTVRSSLTEYYRVDSMDDYGQMYGAVAFFQKKYGPIYRIESHNEHWLSLDARLRTDFGVFGYKASDVDKIRLKSKMKEIFRGCGLPAAGGRVFSDRKDAFELAESLGFPVVIKPDCGVGAGDTFKIKDEEDLETFFATKHPETSYIMEAFIQGDTVTFDGLTDQDGKIVFYSTLIYNTSVLDILEDNTDMFFFIPRHVPQDLIEIGSKIVKAYDVRERFFHFEFFRTRPDGELIPLEVNMRPPGGTTIDMFNYVNDFDIFREYANLVKENEFKASAGFHYYCAYVSRRYSRHAYLYSNDEIRGHLGRDLISIQSLPGVFAGIMGDEGYLVRSPSQDEMLRHIDYIHRKR